MQCVLKISNLLSISLLILVLSIYDHPIKIRSDNSAAVANTKNVGAKARTRHYERWMQLGRDQYIDKFSEPEWINKLYQIAHQGS